MYIDVEDVHSKQIRRARFDNDRAHDLSRRTEIFRQTVPALRRLRDRALPRQWEEDGTFRANYVKAGSGRLLCCTVPRNMAGWAWILFDVVVSRSCAVRRQRPGFLIIPTWSRRTFSLRTRNKAQVAARMVSGEAIGSLGMTSLMRQRPQGDPDPRRARRRRFVINGQKVFIPTASSATSSSGDQDRQPCRGKRGHAVHRRRRPPVSSAAGSEKLGMRRRYVGTVLRHVPFPQATCWQGGQGLCADDDQAVRRSASRRRSVRLLSRDGDRRTLQYTAERSAFGQSCDFQNTSSSWPIQAKRPFHASLPTNASRVHGRQARSGKPRWQNVHLELHCETDECLQLFGGGIHVGYPMHGLRRCADRKIAGGSIEIMKTIIARQCIRSTDLRCRRRRRGLVS